MSEIITLDWHKDFGIEVVPSIRTYEDYQPNIGQPIRVIAKTICFVAAWGLEMVENLLWAMETTPKLIQTTLKYIEMIDLIDTLASYSGKFNDTYLKLSLAYLIKPISEKAKKLDFLQTKFDAKEQIVLKQLLAKHLKDKIDNKNKLIFQLRKPWEIIAFNDRERCGAPDIKILFRSRFNFAIIPKEAERVEGA